MWRRAWWGRRRGICTLYDSVTKRTSKLCEDEEILWCVYEAGKTKKRFALLTSRRYSCGPTVYDQTHLGHARNYVQVDVMHRLLEAYGGYRFLFFCFAAFLLAGVGSMRARVVHVMGITDVDDKIINKAKERGMQPAQLAAEQEAAFLHCMARLGVRPPAVLTRVTEHIGEIVSMVERIVANGLAYATEEGVYFDTAALRARHGEYYWLGSGHEQEQGGEEEASTSKRSKADFALWKRRDPQVEPYGWNTSLGFGRPGWHIECSAMIEAAFPGKKKLTVHSGGVDLCFPHHNNEIAQTLGARGGSVGDWFGHFVHVGHLHIEGRKMSKSLKNFITVDEFLSRYPADALRMFVLMHHYRAGTSFSETKMQDAMAVLAKLRRFVEEIGAPAQCATLKMNEDDFGVLRAIRECDATVTQLLVNDLQTNEVVHRLMELTSLVYKYAQSESRKRNVTAQAAIVVSRFLHASGLEVRAATTDTRADALAQAAVDIRGKFKDWSKTLSAGEHKTHALSLSDWAREHLKQSGVEVRDAPKGGYTWRWRD